jgi:prepilin-type N-terminal cleavage/methylation domain-containing protein
MIKKTHQSGFTLIELLVVIAVIGILASVVLASLSTSREKGNNAGIKSNLSGARAEAEIFYGNNSNTFGAAGAGTGVCATTGTNTIGDSVLAAIALSSRPTAYDAVNETCFVTAGTNPGWAAAVQMNNTTTTFFCVDSAGAAKEIQGTYPIGTTDVVC